MYALCEDHGSPLKKFGIPLLVHVERELEHRQSQED